MAMNRREARQAAFELLFETEFKSVESGKDIFELFLEVHELEADEYIKTVYFGVLEHKDEIDALIGKYAKGWKTARISRVSRSILRLSIFEMLYLSDIPASVSINEAVELTRKYSSESSCAFVNGVLGTISRKLAAKA